MRIGVSLRGFFYRKVGSPPIYEDVYEDGMLVGIKYLPIPQLRRATEDVLSYVEKLGVECVEMYNTLERIEALIPVLRNRGDMELVLHECNAELWYPGSRRISSRNPQVRMVVTESLKWLIDMAGEMKARAIVLHGAAFDDTARGEDFGAEDVFGFEEARRLEIELLKECSERAREKGVILALESSEPRAQGASKGDVTGTAEELAEIVDEVGSEAVGCTFDVGHAGLRGSSPMEYVKKLGKRIATYTTATE